MPKRRREMSVAERRRRTARVWMGVAAAALVINGVTVTVLLTHEDDRTRVGVSGVYDDPRAEDAIEIAQTQVLGVVSLDATSGDPEVAELADRTTATFRTDFDTFLSVFLDEVKAKGIQVRSQIAAAGIAELVGDSATIIVATSGEASKSDAVPARTRDFAMLVGLAYTRDGWRIEKMEFV